MRREEKTIPSKNGILLNYTEFHPDQSVKNNKAIIISPAMAVKQHYYKSFANHVCEMGFYVVTFNNIGVGKKKLDDLNYYDWARFDLTIMINLVYDKKYDEIIYIAHSAGGQLLGLTPSYDKLSKIFIVNSGIGYWKLWPFPRKIYVWTMWYFLYPIFLKIYGHSPKWAMGEKLPNSVISQWLKWGRKKRFMLDFDEFKENNFFKDIKVKIHGINFTDDTYAPKKSAERLISFYQNAEVEFRSYKPKDFGFKEIGHFGFFKSKYSELWKLITEKL